VQWLGATHLAALLLPYCGRVLHPTAYFVCNNILIALVLVNCIGSLGKGCWAWVVFIELPMLVLSCYLGFALSKTDPDLRYRLRNWLGCGFKDEPVVSTHPVAACSHESVPQLTVVSEPMVEPSNASTTI
jgi:hypothetical protein